MLSGADLVALVQAVPGVELRHGDLELAGDAIDRIALAHRVKHALAFRAAFIAQSASACADDQALACVDRIAGTQVIKLRQGCNRDSVTARDAVERLARAHPVHDLVQATAGIGGGPIDACSGEQHFLGQLVARGGHLELIAGGNLLAGKVVDLRQDRHRRTVLLRDLRERFLARDRVREEAHALRGGEAFQRGLERVGIVDRHEQAVRTIGVRRPAVVAGVKRDDFIVPGTREPRGDLQVYLGVDVDDRKIGLVRDGREIQAIALGFSHQALHRQEFWNVRTRLGRQIQVPEVSRLAGRLVAVELALN